MAAHADDLRHFYAADIGDTLYLQGVAAGAQLADTVGALRPGRYLIQVRNFSVAGSLCWIHVGKFTVGVTLTMAAAAGSRRVPLSEDIPAIEYNARTGESDRIGAFTSAGTCDVYITRVSAGKG